MKSLTKSVLSVLLVLTLVIASFVPAYAASGDSTTLYNEGQRDEVCTSFDNTTAPDYYTGSYTYDNLSTLSASSLKSSLNTLMSSTHEYTSSYDDCHYLADHTDCQNGDGSVSLIYTNYSATMSQWNGWNREHVWPKSLGGDTTTGGGADLHHIRPSDAVVNSTRSNNKYGYASGGSEVYGKNPATGYLGGYYADGYFEPLDNVKGDVARICLYVYVRWGSSWGATDITAVFESVDVLLDWCELDPVDTWEMERNDVVEDIQGNRNVFIDYPEYAWLLFNETIPDDMITPSGEAMGGNTSGGSTTCTHTNKTTTTVDATCTTAGSVTVKCADCGSVVSKITVAATGHTYVDGVCSVCGDSSTVSPPSTDGEGIEFTFGDNGTASHVDGSEISGSKTYTSGAYELTITSPSKVYHSAFDAQGNSALKFGTGSYVGSMTFTVPNDVTSVQIHAAKYKESTSYIVINGGTPQSLTSNSNDGQYDVITVDTSTQKTVNVATDSSGKRMMIDKIVYVIPSTDTPDTSSCEHTNKTTSVVGATCTVAGSETVTCDDCGEEISTTPIPATGHQNTTETTVEATCTTAGSVKLICDECGYVVSQSEIAALGHSYGTDGKCSICGLASGSGDVESGETVEGEVTLTFDDTSKRTTYTTSQQIWEENGITLTNNKSSSTSNVADYASPARFYKNSEITVEYPGMTKIVFSCNTTEYASALANSIAADSNYTVSTSGKNVTVAFADSVDNFTVSSLSGGQVRMDSLTVFYGVSVDTPDCEHTNTTTTTVEASCTVAGSTTVTCDDCGVTISEEEIAALGHSYSDGVCTVCGNEQSSSSGAEEITVTVIIADYADANGWANGTQYSTISVDSNISVTAIGGGNTGKYYTSGENWRLYQSESASVTFTAGNGAVISSIKITYESSSSGILTFGGANVASGTAVTVNAASATFSVGNSGSGTSGQARITAIDIVYEQPAACEHINTTETTVDATCTEAGSRTVTCDDCGVTISEEEISATGHSYSDGVCTVCGDEKLEGFVLVTDVNDLNVGDQIIIVAKDSDYALSTNQKSNNRDQIAIIRTNGIIAQVDGLQIITLEAGTVDGTFAFNVGNGYLYAASSSSNYLKTQTTNDANGSWKIEIAADGTATVKAQGTYTRNWMRYNSQSALFACYSSGQQDILIYKLPTNNDTDFGFSGASLNIGSDLSIRYHVVPEEGKTPTDYSVRFTYKDRDNNDKVIVVTDCKEENGKYVFSFCGIAPQCMGDTIKAELLYNGEVIDVIEEYSVKQYVISALALHSTDTELCRLLSDMLYYGAAAQKYVSYKTDALVTDGVAGILSALDTVPSDSDKNRSLVTEDGADTSVEFIAAGVRFDYNNRIYVKLTTADITNVTVTVGGAELEIISLGNNTYIAYSDGISALDFDVEISFELRRGGTLIQTLTYTVNTYAWDKQDNDKIGELALALYRYGESAKEYAN